MRVPLTSSSRGLRRLPCHRARAARRPPPSTPSTPSACCSRATACSETGGGLGGFAWGAAPPPASARCCGARAWRRPQRVRSPDQQQRHHAPRAARLQFILSFPQTAAACLSRLRGTAGTAAARPAWPSTPATRTASGGGTAEALELYTSNHIQADDARALRLQLCQLSQRSALLLRHLLQLPRYI